MKKIISIILVISLISLTITFSVFANEDIKVILNGTVLEFDQPPIIVYDRTLLPMRTIFEAMGADVIWYDGTIVATKNNDVLYAFIDQNLGILNNKSIYFDVTPMLYNDKTMVPVRVISEAFGATVTWDNVDKSVKIIFPEKGVVNSEKGIVLNENVVKNISIYEDVDDFFGTFESPSNLCDADMLSFGVMTLYKTTDFKWEDYQHLDGYALIPKNLLDPIFERYFGITNFTPNDTLVFNGKYIVYPFGLEGNDFRRISQIRIDNNGNTIIKLEILVISLEEMPQEYIKNYGNETVFYTSDFYQDWIDGKLPQFEPNYVYEMTFDTLGHIVKYVNIN